MKDQYQNLSQTKWRCKYHVIFIPECRRSRLFGVVRGEQGGVFRRLAGQKGCEIHEGHVMPDHVRMLTSIPPKQAFVDKAEPGDGSAALHEGEAILAEAVIRVKLAQCTVAGLDLP